MTERYTVRELDGSIFFEGSIEQVANILKIPRVDVYDAKNTGEVVKGKYTIKKQEKRTAPNELEEHLFNKDGSRCYEQKKGFPNRYKDASCVRFTPL